MEKKETKPPTAVFHTALSATADATLQTRQQADTTGLMNWDVATEITVVPLKRKSL